MRRAYAPDTEHALDDEELQRRIEERIDSDPAFWTVVGKRRTKSLIAVDVDEGYVTLSGSVRSASERRRADILARALGARRVDNRLQVESEVDARAS